MLNGPFAFIHLDEPDTIDATRSAHREIRDVLSVVQGSRFPQGCSYNAVSARGHKLPLAFRYSREFAGVRFVPRYRASAAGPH